MAGTLQHAGYTGSVEFSEEDGLLYGRLIGIRDVVTYEGKDVKSLTRNFRLAVEEYLAFCEAEGKTPDRAEDGASESIDRGGLSGVPEVVKEK